MKIKSFFCFILLSASLPVFAANVAKVGNSTGYIQVYNNSDSPIRISDGEVMGSDLINQDGKRDCDGLGTKMCVGVLPNKDITIAPGKEYTFKVISNIKSPKTATWISGAVLFNIYVATQPFGVDNKVTLPVQVNTGFAWVVQDAVDSTGTTYSLGAASTTFPGGSETIKYPRYLMSVTFDEDSDTTAIVINNYSPPVAN